MWADRWGVSDAEVARTYPCDAFVAEPVLQAWRGVTVAAPPARVWPWIGQVRLAPYSYDWIDNLGRRSPGELSDLSDPTPGEHFTMAGGRRLGRIVAVEPGVSFTGRLGAYYMSYVLVPEGDATRLLLKVSAACGRLAARLVCAGDLVMARRQLLNFKRLSESSAATVQAVSGTILLLHGPNLNLLGQREPEVYGTDTLDDYVDYATKAAAEHGLAVEAYQSNAEGALVDRIHAARGTCAAIIINPGAFTHYAWAIHDALKAFDGPVVEVHISNPNAREPWRHTSVVAPASTGSIMGFGKHGYDLAVRAVAAKLVG